MQGQVKFQLQKLHILQVVSAGFPHFKSDVTTCFSCGNCTYTKFPNRFCMLHYLESPSFSKFQSMETVWYSEQTSIPHCKNVLNLEISFLKLCRNHTYSKLSAQFQRCLSNVETVFFIQWETSLTSSIISIAYWYIGEGGRNYLQCWPKSRLPIK